MLFPVLTINCDLLANLACLRAGNACSPHTPWAGKKLYTTRPGCVFKTVNLILIRLRFHRLRPLRPSGGAAASQEATTCSSNADTFEGEKGGAMRLCITLALTALILVNSAGSLFASQLFLLSHAGPGDPFWKVEFKGAQAAAQQADVELTILAPEMPNDITRQLELLREAIAANPDGIATTVPDSTAFSSALKRARNKGIPLIAFNARPLDDDRAMNPYQAYIGMDDYLAGKVMARKALQSGRLGGHVLVAVQQVGLTGLESRYKGINEVLSREGIQVDRLDVTPNPQTGMRIVQDYVDQHPELSAILCVGPTGLQPVGTLALQKGWDFYIASFDLCPITSKLIKKGVVDFTIDQQPYMQAYLAVQLLNLAARYKMTPPDINTGVGIIDKDNVERVEELARRNIR